MEGPTLVPLSKYDIEAELVNQPGTSHAYMVELIGANKRVLDVGCDTGYLGVALQALGCRVSGVEIDPVTASEAAKRLERVVVADLETFDPTAEFAPGSFDVVVFGDVLEHLRDPLPVLRAARLLLAPGGSVVISTPNIAHGDIRLALLAGRFDYTRVGILDDTHTRFFTRRTVERFLNDAGFLLADLRRTHAPLFSTEVGVQEAAFDAALVATLRADIEATTYQFVLRAVPDDSTNLDLVAVQRLDELAGDVVRLQARLDQLEGEHALAVIDGQDAHAQIALLTARVTQVQAAHDEAVSQRNALAAELTVRAELAESAPSTLGTPVQRLAARIRRSVRL